MGQIFLLYIVLLYICSSLVVGGGAGRLAPSLVGGGAGRLAPSLVMAGAVVGAPSGVLSIAIVGGPSVVRGVVPGRRAWCSSGVEVVGVSLSSG